MLQELLNNGLLDIGSDDSRFEKMTQATNAFVAKLNKNPELIIPSTLIAIESNIEEEDDILDIVENMVIKEWPTMRQHHTNRPREFLRSIIIASISVLIKDSPVAAGIFYNTGINLFKYSKVQSGKAFPIIEKLLNEARELSEKEAVKRASLAPVISKKKKLKKVEEVQPLELELSGAVTSAELLTGVQSAAGPQNEQGTAIADPNPHWTNSAPAWSYTFAPRMSAILAKAINIGTTRLATSIKKSLSIYLASFEERLTEDFRLSDQLTYEMAETQNSLRMRLDVLWWTESLYSSSLKTSYTSLETSLTAVTAGVDLTKVVPALSPESVAYVLGEALYKVCQIKGLEDQLSLAAHLDKIYENKWENLKEIKSTNPRTRQSLLDVIVNTANGIKPDVQNIQKNSGIDISQELSLKEFGMWIFRDLQANRLVKEF